MALCYAELGSAHPDAGGEYRFLTLAYGRPAGLLFAWARGTVIQTGAIAAVAFVYGEYASVILPLGAYSTAIHAASAVIALTGLNVIGTPQTVWAQWGLTSLTIATKLVLIVSGIAVAAPAASLAPSTQTGFSGSIGLATVFVLLTYGGWNEAAYLGGELKDARHNMVRTLLVATCAVIVLYLAVNYAYLHSLGLQGLRDSHAIASDVMRRVRWRYRRNRTLRHDLRLRAIDLERHDLHRRAHVLRRRPRFPRSCGSSACGMHMATNRRTRCSCNARSRSD